MTIVQDYLHADVQMISFPSLAGGTAAKLQILEMICLVLGRPIHGLEVKKRGWCLYVTGEDSIQYLQRRLQKTMESMNLSGDEQREARKNIHFLDMSEVAKYAREEPCLWWDELNTQWVKEFADDPPALIVFASLNEFHGALRPLRETIKLSRRLSQNLGCCVRFLTPKWLSDIYRYRPQASLWPAGSVGGFNIKTRVRPPEDCDLLLRRRGRGLPDMWVSVTGNTANRHVQEE